MTPLKLLGATAMLTLAGTVSAGIARAADPVVVQYLSDNIGEETVRPIIDKLVAEFEAANPDIKIELLFSTNQSTWSRFVAAAQAGEAPCLVDFKDVVPAAAAGYLAPIDDIIARNAPGYTKVYPQGILDGLHWEGKLYGLPMYGGVYADIYNRKMVEAAHLDPNKTPTTWNEYAQWMQALTKGDVHGTAYMAGPTDATTRALFTYIYGAGGSPFNADLTAATFSSNPTTSQAIDRYLGMEAEHKVVAPGATTTTYDEQVNLFAKEQIASIRQPFWSVSAIVNKNPALKGNLIVADPVFAPGGHSVVVVVSQAITKDCKTPDAAWKFIEAMNSRKWMMELQKNANWMPMRTDVLDDPYFKEDPLASKFMALVPKGVMFPFPHPAYNEIAQNVVLKAVQSAIIDPANRKATFEQLDTDVTKLLNDK